MKKTIMIIAINAMIPLAQADTISLNANAYSAVCAVNSDCNLFGTHDIEISNTTDTDHNYSYTYSLCADNGKCHDITGNVTIHAHKTWNNHYDNHEIVSLGWVGNHNVIAKTQVWGYENGTMMGSNFVVVN